jgi:hypothetical protein
MAAVVSEDETDAHLKPCQNRFFIKKIGDPEPCEKYEGNGIEKEEFLKSQAGTVKKYDPQKDRKIDTPLLVTYVNDTYGRYQKKA